jgi:imidazolonepropionase-like amidohydrolase
MMPFIADLTLALHEKDVMITLGGAVSNEGVIPGYHYILQFELLEEAGFAPRALLEMATKNAGIIVDRMGRDGNFGTVEPGRRADLLLLGSNPLEDIGNIRDQLGVMARGRWFTREELDGMVERLAADYRIE